MAAGAAQSKGSLHLDVPKPPPSLEDGAELPYVIVGAGPSGLLTACSLAKAGFQVAVFDTRPRPTEFYGSFPVVLNMRGQSAIKRLGEDILADFKSYGREVDQLHIVPNNRTVAVVDTLGTCIMRDQCVGLLLRLADTLNIPIHWNHKLLDLDPASQTCTFERSASGGAQTTFTVRVGVCAVGADGNYSTVRRVCERKAGLKVDSVGWGLQMRYMLAPEPDPSTNPLPKEVNGAVHYVLGNDGYVCQQPDGVWSVSISAYPGQSEAYLLSEEPSSDNIGKLREYCESKATPFAQHLLTSDDVYTTFFKCRAFNGEIIKCSTLAPIPWICLIGDAAHAVAPFTGEGINSALESASILADVLQKGGSCADFDARRREDAHAVNVIALRNRTIIVGKPEEKCASTFMTIVLGIGKKLGCVRGTIQDYMLGKKAKDGVWRYSELTALDRRQRSCLYPLGMCCFFSCCCWCGKAKKQ